MDFIGIVRDFYETSWILMESNGILMELYGFQRYFRELGGRRRDLGADSRDPGRIFEISRESSKDFKEF